MGLFYFSSKYHIPCICAVTFSTDSQLCRPGMGGEKKITAYPEWGKTFSVEDFAMKTVSIDPKELVSKDSFFQVIFLSDPLQVWRISKM